MPGISHVTAQVTEQYRDYIRISYGHPCEVIQPFRRLEMDNATALPAIYRLQTLVERRSHAASAQQTLNIAAATTHRTLERLIDRRPKSREVQIRKNQPERVNGL
jgi:hypothetical protein